jgi:hypothetical protein
VLHALCAVRSKHRQGVMHVLHQRPLVYFALLFLLSFSTEVFVFYMAAGELSIRL